MSLSRISIFKSIDSSLGSLMCRILGAINYLADGKNDAKQVKSECIKSILIIRPGGMGDMILLLPVIDFVRKSFPDASIKIVCEKRNIDVLRLAGMADNALVYDANPLRFLYEIFNTHFDIAIDTEQFHHFSAVFSILSGAAIRIGFKINPQRNPLYTHLINYTPDGPEGEQFMKLLAPLPVTTIAYKLENSLAGRVTNNDPVQNAPERASYAAIHMGASSKYKLWSTEKYTELINLLKTRHKLNAVIIGGKKDSLHADQVVEKTTNSAKTVSFAGKLNLSETCKLMKDARIFIGTDSGLAHLAIALGLPTVVLFGPSDHLKWGLIDNRHAVVKHELPCSPCFIFGYHKPCKTIACMKRITVENIASACNAVLNSSDG